LKIKGDESETDEEIGMNEFFDQINEKKQDM